VRVAVSAESRARPHRLRADNRNIPESENRGRPAAVHDPVPLDQDIVDRAVPAVARRQSVAHRSCVVAQSVRLAHARRNIDRRRRVRVDQMSVGIFDQSRRPGRTRQDHCAFADRRQPHGVRLANDRFSVPAVRNRSRPARLRSAGRRGRSPGSVRRGRPSNTSHSPG